MTKYHKAILSGMLAIALTFIIFPIALMQHGPRVSPLDRTQNNICPKCGFAYFYLLTYHESCKVSDVEHFHRKCEWCGYSHVEKCK